MSSVLFECGLVASFLFYRTGFFFQYLTLKSVHSTCIASGFYRHKYNRHRYCSADFYSHVRSIWLIHDFIITNFLSIIADATIDRYEIILN